MLAETRTGVQSAQTDRPWLHSCALQGPIKLRIDLTSEASTVQNWKVTLFFHELDNDRPPACFDVKLQGQILLSKMDLRDDGNGAERVVVKELSIKASDNITLELIPRNATKPILNGLEIRRE